MARERITKPVAFEISTTGLEAEENAADKLFSPENCKKIFSEFNETIDVKINTKLRDNKG